MHLQDLAQNKHNNNINKTYLEKQSIILFAILQQIVFCLFFFILMFKKSTIYMYSCRSIMQ